MCYLSGMLHVDNSLLDHSTNVQVMNEAAHKQISYSRPQLQPGNSKLIAFSVEQYTGITFFMCYINFVLK